MPSTRGNNAGAETATATTDGKKSKSSSSTALSVGPTAQRKLKKKLMDSENPYAVIENYQQDYSLHSMVARALDTTPRYEANKEKKESDDDVKMMEPLDTDPVMKFLSHLGVPLHVVHRRVVEALRNQLDDEIKKKVRGDDESSLLDLLKSCFKYATVVPDLRPVLLAVLKQLGSKTPAAALTALAERDKKTGELKQVEIWNSLQPSLKRLVFEADWEDTVPSENRADSKKVGDMLSLMNKSLFGEIMTPLIDEYCNQENLVAKADLLFVATNRERRCATQQRRALVISATADTAATTTNKTSSASRTLQKLSKSKTAAPTQPSSALDLSDSGRIVSEIRNNLGASSGVQASASSSSYRTKLLYAVLEMLISRHGVQVDEEGNGLGGSANLNCTLVSDIFLSSGGSLPKPYRHVVSMVRVLDNCVKAGELSDTAIVTVQDCLRNIFQGETATSSAAASGNSVASPSRPGSGSATPKLNLETKQTLKRVIEAAIAALKEADPRGLFLNPVTDQIAPGYSKVIKKPMCMKTMEGKVENLEYITLEEFERDVKLMYRNCITYNIGNEGQWFRGEARRQEKTFKDDVFPQTKKLYQQQMEKSKRANKPKEDKATDPSKKRKATSLLGGGNEPTLTSDDIRPLDASKSKKRKSDTQQENVPSVPAVASMVLADPFVVRLMLDRVLKLLRIDVLRSEALPAAHKIAPSILQLLQIAQSSCQLCAVRGKRFFISGAGLSMPSETDGTKEDVTTSVVPYETLRFNSPLLLRLFLESELDQRMASGGDLTVAAQSSIRRPAMPTTNGCASDITHLDVSKSLVEGALVYICQPGNSRESSLSVSFPKFATALQLLSENLWYERPFFVSLVQALLRHKSKLGKSNRDVIVTQWLDWFQAKEGRESKGGFGAMTTPMHEFLILLLNEWAALGNLLLPRDDLLKFSIDTVKASEQTSERSFAQLWSESVPEFDAIKTQYTRMLQSIPPSNASRWREQVGINNDSSPPPKDPE